ncbi:MAG TPA: YggS family pyridoxal phosphate-dependent enzyme [Candidatus Limnocylindrales bacterium]|nr:YggS family pyridoxal phosphate-dependent enzyme [Candidatus Limnocylindrales bacterium]
MTGDAAVHELAQAREGVLDRIAAASARAGRNPAAITLVAVSKTVPPERLRAAVAAGLTTLGENRVQEAEGKIGDVAGAVWHLVGPLQKNKARRALEIFGTIESVDTAELATRLDRIAADVRPGERVPVLLEVNVDGDPAKAGFAPADLERAMGGVLDLPQLDVRGLMTIGRQVARPEEARPTFVALRELSTRLRAADERLGPDLSMGMTDDFEVAVEEGATIVRVGRALFGERPHDHDHGDGPHTHTGAD